MPTVLPFAQHGAPSVAEDAPDDRIDVKEASPIAGMTPEAFYYHLRHRNIPPGIWWRVGRTVIVSRSRLQSWVNAGAGAAA